MPKCPKCRKRLIKDHVFLDEMRFDQLYRTKGTDGIIYTCPKCNTKYYTEDFMSESEINKEVEKCAKAELAFIHRDEFIKIKQEILKEKFNRDHMEE